MRVLIIEDDQATSKAIQIALKSKGFVCDCAEVERMG
jgi:DNA-binding response OmpR family regulator